MLCFPDETFLRSRCRRVFISGLTLPCSIGIYNNEKEMRQRLRLDCDVWTLKQVDKFADEINCVLDYDLISGILRQATANHTNLQETLVRRLITKIAELPGVMLVRLSSAKLDAYDDADAVGIEEWCVGSSFSTISSHD